MKVALPILLPIAWMLCACAAGTSAPRCRSDASVACTCESGETGVQSCTASGGFTACVCEPSDAGTGIDSGQDAAADQGPTLDAPMSDAGTADEGAEFPIDLGTDAGTCELRPTAWDRLGASIASRGDTYISNPNITVASDGTMFASWSEGSLRQIAVAKYTTDWDPLGVIPASGTYVDAWHSLTTSEDNTPVIAVSSHSEATHHVQVFRWSGASWMQLGSSQNTGTGATTLPLLTKSASGQLYLAWLEAPTSTTQYDFHLARWAGTDWELVGEAISVHDGAIGMGTFDVAVRGEDEAFVVWNEFDGTRFRMYAAHLLGGAWEQLGSSFPVASSTDDAVNPHIGLGSDDSVYVAYQDYTHGYLRRFNGSSSWALTGDNLEAGISDITAFRVERLLLMGDVPVVALSTQSSGAARPNHIRQLDGTEWMDIATGSVGATRDYVAIATGTCERPLAVATVESSSATDLNAYTLHTM